MDSQLKTSAGGWMKTSEVQNHRRGTGAKEMTKTSLGIV